jgi:HK97 family phage portal protein
MAKTSKALAEATRRAVESESLIEQHYEELTNDSLSEKSWDMVRDETGDGSQGMWEPDVKAFLSATTLKSLFFNDDWVFIIVDLIAKKISSQPLVVMRQILQEGKMTVEPAEGHPVQKILESPNRFQDYHSFMYMIAVDMALIGNSILWRGKSGGQILPISADTIRLEFAKDGSLMRYMSSQMDEETRAVRDQMIAFSPEEICHIRLPNPASFLWGMSPFIPGRRSVLFNRYTSEYLNNFYLKGATPGLALEMDREANEKVALRLLRSFETAYTGRRNQRRTMVLPKGVTAKEVSHSLADQQLATYIDKNRETILATLKVPKHEVGLQSSGSLGSEEYKTALRNFWESTLIPFMKLIEGALTKSLLNQLGQNFFLKFDLSNVPALQEDMDKKAGLAEKLLKTHTLNEVRKELYDLPPLPEGDSTPGVQQNPFGGGMGLSSPVQGQPSTGGSVIPPLGDTEVTEQKPVSADSAETELAARPGRKKADVVKWKKSNETWWNEREQKIKTQAAKSIKDLEDLSLDMFSDMSATITQTALKYLKRKSAEIWTTKANGEPPKAKLVGTAEMRRRLRSALDKFEEKWIDKNRTALTAAVETGYSSMIEVPFNMPSQNEIQALRARNQQVRQDALEERSGRAFRYIEETTINDVFGVIEREIQKGSTVEQIADSLRDKFQKVDQIRSRAMLIARTEALTAVSLGQAAAMQDAATVIPNLKKMWLTADDDRVRDSHAALDGDVEDWDAPFGNGLYFPRDPGGQPDDTINCRCSFISLPADQMDEVSGDNLDSNERR